MTGINKNDTNKRHFPYYISNKYGMELLTDVELLSIIINSNDNNETSYEISEKIYKDYCKDKGLLGLLSYDNKNNRYPKISNNSNQIIKAIIELIKRINKAKFIDRPVLNSPKIIYDYYKYDLTVIDKEKVILLCLDNQNKKIKDDIISIGTINYAIISIRDILSNAIRNNAVKIILIHNHPSGDILPSLDDIEITNKLYKSSKLIGIPLLDHVIIGENNFYSMREAGYINE